MQERRAGLSGTVSPDGLPDIVDRSSILHVAGARHCAQASDSDLAFRTAALRQHIEIRRRLEDGFQIAREERASLGAGLRRETAQIEIIGCATIVLSPASQQKSGHRGTRVLAAQRVWLRRGWRLGGE